MGDLFPQLTLRTTDLWCENALDDHISVFIVIGPYFLDSWAMKRGEGFSDSTSGTCTGRPRGVVSSIIKRISQREAALRSTSAEKKPSYAYRRSVHIHVKSLGAKQAVSGPLIRTGEYARRGKINSSVNAGPLVVYSRRYHSPPTPRCGAAAKNDVAHFGRFVEDSSISSHVTPPDPPALDHPWGLEDPERRSRP